MTTPVWLSPYNDFGPVTEDTNIPCEVTQTNIGGGWSSAANAFMATVDGVYQFSASMRPATTATSDPHCNIVHSSDEGQTTVAAMWGWGYDHVNTDATNSVVIGMEQGHFVSVQLRGEDGAIINSG